MNLLTDIIRDAAAEMNLTLTETELANEQESVLQNIVVRLAWIKHKRLMAEGMPWLEKSKVA